MAFTQAPTQDTDSTHRVQLTRAISARDGGGNKDEDLLNVFIEPVKNKAAQDSRHFVIKRAGTQSYVGSLVAEDIRGWFFWEDLGNLYYCVNNDIYVYNVNTAVTATISNCFTTTSGVVGFCLFQYEIGTTKLVATDGTATVGMITIDSANTVVTNADADLVAHLPYPVYIDGYIFVIKTGTADILNSDLDDPLSWDPAGFITAEMEGDNLLRLGKVNNYLVAFGSESIEYFWDAANAAPGSPLQRNDTPIKINTYLAGFAQFGNTLYYIGVNEGGQPDVYMLKDFRIEELGTPTLSRHLNTCNTATSTWKCGIVSFKGHTFYVLNTGANKTFVMDVETKLWARWGWAGNDYFTLNASLHVVSNNGPFTLFSVSSTPATSTIYRFLETAYGDGGIPITCMIVTEASDFGTLNRKSMRRLSFIADRPTITAPINVQWSDDDYQSFNSPGINVNLNQDLPCVYRLGNFRQRNFKFTYEVDADLRLQEVEVEVNKGR